LKLISKLSDDSMIRAAHLRQRSDKTRQTSTPSAASAAANIRLP